MTMSSWRRGTSRGTIDFALWKAYPKQCQVRRFWDGEDDRVGVLVHKPGGSEHARWYVTLRDQDTEHTFKIVSVERAA